MKRGQRPSSENPARPSAASGASQFPYGRELSRAAASGSLFVASLELAKEAARRDRTVVLVEGISDLLAVNRLAQRLGRDLHAEGISTVAMGGATNIRHFLRVLGPEGFNVETAGLCDLDEERHLRHALERSGFGPKMTRSDMEELGFFVCEADLEDELIRCLGAECVLQVAAAQGELERFRMFQNQQAWREWGPEAQLHRWLGVKTLRKFRYATLLVDALSFDRMPLPLLRLLAHLSRPR